MKKNKKKIRNVFALLAKAKRGGKMRDKKDKRKNGKNKQTEFLSEDY